MPTRFYLQSSGTTVVSPAFNGAWEQTGQAVRVPLVRKSHLSATTPLTDSAAVTIPITTVQQVLAYQCVGAAVFQPAFLDASVTYSLVVRCSEAATTNNAFLAFVLRAVSADGARALVTLASSMTNAGTEYTTAAQTRIFGPSALNAALMVEPWRVVLEIGSHAQAPSAAGSFVHRIGSGAATDFALTTALTTDLNPWLELSRNLNETPMASHQSIKAGGGISVSGSMVR
jgi:hypothetical protein